MQRDSSGKARVRRKKEYKTNYTFRWWWLECEKFPTAAFASSLPLTFASASHCSTSRFSRTTCASRHLFTRSSRLRLASSRALTRSSASRCACCSSASKDASMSGADTAAAFAPCVLAGVMKEHRDEGADVGVEDKEVYTVKLSPVPIYPSHPDFKFHQTSATPISRGAQFKLH